MASELFGTFHLINVFLGTGTGTFSPPTRFNAGTEVTNLQLADLDDDGHIDLIASGTNEDKVSVLLGVGNGTFSLGVTFPVSTGGRPHDPSDLHIADVNVDGSLDVIVVNQRTRDFSIPPGVRVVVAFPKGPKVLPGIASATLLVNKA